MILIGTSGYNYNEWKGNFYPADLAASKMLGYYSERFSTVEINYTFYRMPNEKVVAGWARETPDEFTFTLKAPRRITHDARLANCRDLTEMFCNRAGVLGDKLAVLLFQLPPSFRKDVGVLEEFLSWLPDGARAAFEFRNNSWNDEEVFGRLRERNLALCITDNEKGTTPMEATADYGYLRLRDEGYEAGDIDGWAEAITGNGEVWRDTYVYFKHEDQGKGPEFAEQLEQSLKALSA